MKFLPLIFCGLLSFSLLQGCASSSNPEIKLSNMQLRHLTTKEFQADNETTFKAVLSVLQDQNYIIKNADIDSGFISCEKQVDLDTNSNVVLMKLFVDTTYSEHNKILISATISQQSKDSSRVRLNIQSITVGDGVFANATEEATFITDNTIYTSLFNQISTEIARLKALE